MNIASPVEDLHNKNPSLVAFWKSRSHFLMRVSSGIVCFPFSVAPHLVDTLFLQGSPLSHHSEWPRRLFIVVGHTLGRPSCHPENPLWPHTAATPPGQLPSAFRRVSRLGPPLGMSPGNLPEHSWNPVFTHWAHFSGNAAESSESLHRVLESLPNFG